MRNLPIAQLQICRTLKYVTAIRQPTALHLMGGLGMVHDTHTAKAPTGNGLSKTLEGMRVDPMDLGTSLPVRHHLLEPL